VDRSKLSSFFLFHQSWLNNMKIKETRTEAKKEEDNKTKTSNNLYKNPDFQAFLMNRPYQRFSRVYSS